MIFNIDLTPEGADSYEDYTLLVSNNQRAIQSLITEFIND
jgi:hypothetical protein